MRLSYPYALCLTILILEQNPFHPRCELFKNFLHFPFISYHFFFSNAHNLLAKTDRFLL